MYYKAFTDGKITDALEGFQCVRYFPEIKKILRCRENEDPEGIISGDGQKIWQVEGWPKFPESVCERISGTVTLIEIEEEEYLVLKGALESGETVEQPESEPDPEYQETLEYVKEKRIAVSKKNLAAYLEEHPLVSTAHGGVEGTYSVTEEKQNLMALNYTTYQIKKAAGMETELTWNETGKACEVWTEQEFVQLILEIETYVKPLVSRQQEMEVQIQAATTLKGVDAIEISF